MEDRALDGVAKAVLRVLGQDGTVEACAYEGNGGRADFVVCEEGRVAFYKLRVFDDGAQDMPDPELTRDVRVPLERAMASWAVENGLHGTCLVAGFVDVLMLDGSSAFIRRTVFA